MQTGRNRSRVASDKTIGYQQGVDNERTRDPRVRA